MDTDRATTTTMDDDLEEDDADQPKRRFGCGCWIALIAVLLLGGAASAFLMGTIITRQETPLPGEEFITDLAIRNIAVPAEYHDMKMPKSVNAQRGGDLFGAQCALCHGQNGDGNGDFGKTMYPKAANLKETRTQQKSDGQLFWLIAHGVNLSGMPGFGQNFGAPGAMGANSDAEIWDLVAYVRTIRK